MKMNITTPTLLLDEQKCRKNIEKLVQKATDNQLVIRPHFKTHQSHEVGRWFREAGIRQITVSSFAMAAYFVEDGFGSPHGDEYEMYEEPDKMTYTEQANKRSHCRRLTR